MVGTLVVSQLVNGVLETTRNGVDNADQMIAMLERTPDAVWELIVDGEEYMTSDDFHNEKTGLSLREFIEINFPDDDRWFTVLGD